MVHLDTSELCTPNGGELVNTSHANNEGSIVCIVRNTFSSHTGSGGLGKLSILVRPSYTVRQLVDDIATQFNYSSEEFELVLQTTKDGDSIVLSNFLDKTCGESGINFSLNARNTLIVSPQRNYTRRKALTDEDGLGLCVSEDANSPCESTLVPTINVATSRETVGFVGLVNQAMTCYLNSLLQALYMTPEFRNALYNWQFDGNGESKSIPFQLQQLFLQLQTSERAAVETTSLTRSFGWDSTEAWQQHDVQELCRVMFDALEQKFHKTEQADLINNLYQGKMIDYVRCLRCNTEKSREDTFLDIPLPVRPFGSTVAYNSIQEALQAFVQPETLEGNNQYYCEICEQKCDAHKGLKFKRFPYLLTLHLKRFDFDYQTLHRVKLNDKVTFPEFINLDGLINNVTEYNGSLNTNDELSRGPPYDDNSTTDSGSALDYDGHDKELHTSNYDSQDYDEGIDMAESNNFCDRAGCYRYELFSIMIHSGSASGGHYYAYIKDFKSGHWFCFNDQTVTLITQEDIQKSYGGGSSKGYYSGAYSSSTNAYMLMYRQIDPQRNSLAMDVQDFPDHIKDLLQRCREHEASERNKREVESGMCKIRLFARDVNTHELIERKMYVYREVPLSEVTQDALQRLQWNEGELSINIDDCRLVMYDQASDSIAYSLEDKENISIGEILASQNSNYCDMFLEIRQEPGLEFKRYEPGGINMKIFIVNLETEDVKGPLTIRGNMSQNVLEFKNQLIKELNLQIAPEKLCIGSDKYYNGPRLLDNDTKLKTECLHGQNKFFVSIGNGSEESSKLKRIIERFGYIITLNITLPPLGKETLEKLAIPDLDSNLNTNIVISSIKPTLDNSLDVDSGSITHSPILPLLDGEHSGDSSLSESDRTLVGDVPVEMDIQDADKHVSIIDLPETEIHYYKSSYLKEGTHNLLKVLIDKRMVVGDLKKCLSEDIGIPVDYFKLFRIYSARQECECSRYNESIGIFRDDENLIIRLGRTLRPGEYRGKIFLLQENEQEYSTFLCEWVLTAGQTVGQFKTELLQAHPQLGLPYERWRVRKKNWKNPAKIYLDSMKFSDDITLFSNWEFFLQDLAPSKNSVLNKDDVVHEIPNAEINVPVTYELMTSPEQLALFVRRWRPSLLKLDQYEEIVLDGMTTHELKLKLHNISGIPLDDIEFAKAPSTFPCDTSVLTLHNNQDWNPQVATLDAYPLHVFEDGTVFYYRDKNEKLREVNSEEKREILMREGHAFGRQTSLASGQSPKRERALKIYLDNSPKKELID